MYRFILLALLAVLVAVPRGLATGYVAPVAAVVVQPTIVTVPTPVALFQYAAPATTPPPVVLSPSLIAAHEARERELSAEVARLRAAVARLEQSRVEIRTASSGPPMIAEPDGPPQAVAPTVSREALIVRAAQIATVHCQQCHSGANARGDVTLFNAAGTFEPNVSWEEIYRAVSRKKNPMPKGQSPLLAEEVEVYRQLRAQANNE